MRSCIVKAHHAGLFSLINKVVTSALLYDHVHVDWTGGHIYHGDGNLWDTLFEPTENRGGDVIVDYPNTHLTWCNAAKLYTGDQLWRTHYHEIWRSFAVHPGYVRNAASFIEQQFGGRPFVSALVRSNHHSGEQPDGRLHTLEEYARAMEAAGDLFYLCACDCETVEWFRQRFGNALVWDTSVNRAPTRENELHLQTPQTHADAALALVEVIRMSMAQAHVHIVSNMSTNCLIINPELKSVYLK